MNHVSYFALETICTNKGLLLESRLYILQQLMSKFILTCKMDFTVFSLSLFLSFVHCAETSENMRSTHALLTGIEITTLIS